MKKKMMYLIIGAVLLIIGFVVYKSSQLKSIEITKSVTINAPQAEVFELVINQNDFHKWSPFLAKDPKLKYEIKEVSGNVGSQLHWSGGSKGEDLGYQEVISVNAPNETKIKCDIQKPFASQSVFSYKFSESGGATTVTQTFDMQSSFVSAFFIWAFGAKGEIDKTNELGLELLKKASEKK